MCRIASLFSLQRLKENMSGDARDFNNIETRAVKFFSPPARQGAEGNSYHSGKNWVAQFKHGDFSTCDAPRPGRPKTVTTPEIIDQIHKIIFEDCRISAKLIAEQLDISRERVGSIKSRVWSLQLVSFLVGLRYLSARPRTAL